MARPGSLLSLLDEGKLRTGTMLRHQGRRHKAITATVLYAGIEVRGQVFKSPSGAARSITGKPVDGWNFWKLPDGRPLASLR
jgi:Restriction Enzyme Adenine Methylase Associated